MQSVQLSAFLMLGVFIIIATTSSDLQKNTEKENTCPVVTCGAAGANGLPGRDGRDGPKGEKGDLGLQGPRGLQGLPGKVGPAGLKGDKGSEGTKGEKGSSEGDGQQSVQSMIEKLTTLQDNFNKLKNGKEVGSKLFVTDGLEYNYETARRVCSRAGGLVAAPRTADENHALQEIVSKHDKRSLPWNN
uniref:Mannose-binding protein-like isoform X2 n=1 Tax=Geotrypetes seraphini TaxID=260995 RepID=A0A6P8R968_GEOSA|nr:mannose-binding protein-like isoform X2 [Geotrypetes seraphini]